METDRDQHQNRRERQQAAIEAEQKFHDYAGLGPGDAEEPLPHALVANDLRIPERERRTEGQVVVDEQRQKPKDSAERQAGCRPEKGGGTPTCGKGQREHPAEKASR
jgi:hypothetical protein